MKSLSALLFPMLLVGTLGAKSQPSFRFDSATSVPLDCEIQSIVIETEETKDQAIKEAMDLQLMFLSGKFSQWESSADVAHAEIKIQKVETVPNSDLRKITYNARMLVAWSKKHEIPATLEMAFPAKTDEKGLQTFFDKYSSTCSEDKNDADLSAEEFFYYYRPDTEGCEVLKGEVKADVVSRATMQLHASKSQSCQKYPEYHKVWADGKLVATCIFGTNKAGAKSILDVGIQSYNRMYQSLRKRFGRPKTTNAPFLGPLGLPGMRHPKVEMEWELEDKKIVNVSIHLVDKEGLIEPTEEFQQDYNERTKISDYVSYNGHSGYGENIRALTSMGSFSPNQWQLYLINGCGTFAYVDDSLRKAHEVVNPGSKPYEWFNVITNAMPSRFFTSPMSNMLIIDSMIGGRKTYNEILQEIDPYQKANVMGEEENVFVPKQ